MTLPLLFAVSVALLLWPWAGYPAALALRAWLKPRPVRAGWIGAPPRTSIILVARDEERHLPEKLASLREAQVPADRLEVIVADDGSRDATAEIAAAHGARVLRATAPRGKAAALNDAAQAATGDVIVFTDARQQLAPGALAELLAPFADPRVGAVAGELVGAARGAGGIYRRFDDALRRLEARTGSAVGVAGALWACRRSLFPLLPAGLILDDVLAPMLVARAGRRVVVAPGARAIERATATAPDVERRRRIRTLAGNLQLVQRAPWLLVPGVNPLWARFLGHKLLRLAGPFALVGALASLAALAPTGAGWAGLAAGAIAALAGAALGHRLGLPGLLLRGFVEAQLLVLAAIVQVVRGRTETLWRPTPAAAPGPPAPTEPPRAAPEPSRAPAGASGGALAPTPRGGALVAATSTVPLAEVPRG